MTTYNKLVRDLIPDIIKFSGVKCEYYNATSDEMKQLLVNKLAEESNELLKADFNGEEALEELADVMEVLYGMARYMGYTERDLNNLRNDKKRQRGGFETGVVLVSTNK